MVALNVVSHSLKLGSEPGAHTLFAFPVQRFDQSPLADQSGLFASGALGLTRISMLSPS
ncbi:uncharacterized protein BP01DRAFT_356189 [Aspergillus saccharolyticus JOP 1030-1]|uniref:Uncharacterized protein n=1 Tax=Aspergillus saccharolyticus JOP 1030-1 TaxID=1450539 RepID=A0A318ZEP5_9EURO|nr:hypothetical protein BP01DRAFT_356189 [Aspergillus saccharolyticus JOP 1030-1]PYH46016.1 hypothetical protein BP01DRAFT_356189 [Aspergillus saccharolyticus JOP 1030-1]